MILIGKKLKCTPFNDSRGHYGESGQLHIAEDIKGTRFLVKNKPADVTNEYVVHRLARIIGVPTSDAVLIDNGSYKEVGIVFEKSFKRIPMDDFIGDDIYPDDSPYLADLISYLALRDMVAMGDNHQIATARKRLISFDYADSFFLSDATLGAMCTLNTCSFQSQTFADQIILRRELYSITRTLQRPLNDFIIDAYCKPLFNFLDADLTPIIRDLEVCFPEIVPKFYSKCFDIIRKAINELIR